LRNACARYVRVRMTISTRRLRVGAFMRWRVGALGRCLGSDPP
jgi:hypothetical protein